MGAFSRILIVSCLWLAAPAWAEDAPTPPPEAAKPAEPVNAAKPAEAAKPGEPAEPAKPSPDSQKSPAKEQRTLEGFGRDNASCREWSDGCAVCVRAGDGAQACSLPGIACTPGAITCRHEADKAPDKPNAPAK